MVGNGIIRGGGGRTRREHVSVEKRTQGRSKIGQDGQSLARGWDKVRWKGEVGPDELGIRWMGGKRRYNGKTSTRWSKIRRGRVGEDRSGMVCSHISYLIILRRAGLQHRLVFKGPSNKNMMYDTHTIG